MPSPPRRFTDLAELAALRDALAREAEDVARREREARVAAERAEREASVFRDAIGPVVPLSVAKRVQHPRQSVEPIAHQHMRDEAEALASSVSDEFDADALLEVDEQSSWRRDGIGPEIVKKLRRGHWITQSEVDLHGARVDQAREMVAQFLREAVRQQHRCVRIVHGKGHGSIGKQPVLKGKVRNWLIQKDEVLAFCHAREVDGGGGALIVLLRPS